MLLARDLLVRVVLLALVAGPAAAQWRASTGGSPSPMQLLVGPGSPLGRDAIERLRQRMRPAAPVEPRLAWVGADVDGDGAPDFANPTGAAPREHDGFGSGAFGASRDGGARRHAGVDYVATAGQPVAAPISGYVTRIGLPYGDDAMRYVEISNPALNYVARVFYVEPTVSLGQTVALGTPIGSVASLQHRYPGITDHVHLELSHAAGPKLDPNRLIVADRPTGDRG